MKKTKQIMQIVIACLWLFVVITPLPAAEIHDVVRAGNLPKIRELVEKDPALANLKTPGGQTPLMDAVMSRRLDIAEYLIEKGADVNARNSFNVAPLHIACRQDDSLKMARLLIVKGADINAVAKYLGKPLDLAEDSNNVPLVQYLKSMGANDTPLEFETHRLGNHLERIAFPWGMRNNVVLFFGSDGILIVDSGFSKRAVPALKKTIGNFARGEVTYVINTHSNNDHVAGNEIAAAPANVIGLKNLASEALKAILFQTDKPLRGWRGLELPAPYRMRFNNEDILLIPYPGLHSQDDLLVYFRTSGVVCMGDLLLSQSCPAVRDVAGYMDFLDKVLDIFPVSTKFVSGHGRELTLVDLNKYSDALRVMMGTVKKSFVAGKSPEDMIKEDILRSFKAAYSFLDWLGPDNWIRQICRGLQTGSLR